MEVNVSKAVQECRHSDNAARSTLLQSLKEEVGEQEVTKVVHSKREAEAILCASLTNHT